MAAHRVLVANRGEIACRILRGLRALGVPSVAIFTPPDAHSYHLTLADEAVALAAPHSYLDAAAVLEAARQTGATAVHPGYGFLSQSPAFVRACVAAGLIFVGPSAQSMEAVGDKRAARRLAQRLGIAVVPGAEAIDGDHAQVQAAVRAFAATAGYPLLIKAAAAGGGRGLRRVEGGAELAAAVQAAAREAHASVGDGRLLVERWLDDVRHVEVQVLGDGQVVRAVGDRDCSLQRRYQKVIEEGPAPTLRPATRATLYHAAERLLAAANYKGAGTVEFLLADDGTSYFLEVNPRLQVEHPVTELTSGLDLVTMQLELALHGRSLRDFVPPASRGHAIEARLNAEVPSKNFLPSTGKVTCVRWPAGPGVRVDAGVAESSQVGAHYDALLAKIIAYGSCREEARLRLLQALEECVVLGVAHNQAFLLQLLRAQAFVCAASYTTTLETIMPAATPSLDPSWQRALAAHLEAALHPPTACAAPTPGVVVPHRRSTPFSARDAWRMT